MAEQIQRKYWFHKREEEPEEDPLVRIKEMQYECILMERYISNIGKEIPRETLTDLSKLAVFVKNFGKRSEKVEQFQVDDDILTAMYDLALKTHNQLSLMAKPANAISIRYTEFTRGFFLKNNPVVNSLIVLTIFFLVAYILTKALNTIDVSVRLPLLIIFASGLGAGFYTLSTVRRYLINRSYNPRYNPTYLIRFFLGIAAGCILAFILKDSVGSGYSLEVLAVVGGFAADAVGIILTRISEILIATFKGIEKENDNADDVTRQEKELIKKKAKLDSAGALADIRAAAKKENASSDLLKAIDDSLKKLEEM